MIRVAGIASIATLLAGSAALAAPAPMDWSGFYAGIEGSVTRLTDTGNYNPDYSPPYDPYYWQLNAAGFGGGLFAGYEGKVSDMFVLGVEGELELNSVAVRAEDSNELKETWSGSIKAKFGVPVGGVLLYGTAGLAAAHFDGSDYWTKTTDNVFDDLGGVVGIGLEAPVADHVIAKIEGDYTMYAAHTYRTTGGSPFWDTSPSTLSVTAGVGVKF